jgi:phosphoribosylglycinamide formyltransferase-1
MSVRPPLRLAILISGRGTNMLAIARACLAGQIAARVNLVISDRATAGGLASAGELGIETATVLREPGDDPAVFEQRLATALDAQRPDVIALAGFMRILSGPFVERYLGRMLNIHPSILPAYRGLHTHRRVLEAGDAWHGASVHFVTPELDGGPVVLQSRVPVQPGDTESTLSARVQASEYIIYPRVLGWFAQGRLTWQDDAAWLDGRPLVKPLVEDFGAPID